MESYNMDHTEMIKKLDKEAFERLLKGGYLKKIPECKFDDIIVYGKDDRFGEYSSSGDLTTDGIITCSVHGP